MSRIALPYMGEDDAVLVNSGEWTGRGVLEAQEKMAALCGGEWLWQARR